MATKTISIREDVYDALNRMKLPDESFSEELERLTESKGDLDRFFGSWKSMSEEEKKSMEKAIERRREYTREVRKSEDA